MIIDVNAWHKFLATESGNPGHYADAKPVRKWLKNSGKIACSPETLREIFQNQEAKTALNSYWGTGTFQLVASGEIDRHVRNNRTYSQQRRKIRSNDLHILDLAATITGGRSRNCVALWTDDEDLIEDFKKMKLGKVYKNRTHARTVLDKTKCP